MQFGEVRDSLVTISEETNTRHVDSIARCGRESDVPTKVHTRQDVGFSPPSVGSDADRFASRLNVVAKPLREMIEHVRLEIEEPIRTGSGIRPVLMEVLHFL